MAKKKLKDLTPDERRLLRAAVNRPGVELAERVGRFEPPFESYRDVVGGFDEQHRFVLNKVLDGDADAMRARDFEIAVKRDHRLEERAPDLSVNLWREYVQAHEQEFVAFRTQHYPWVGLVFRSAPDPNFDREHPDRDALLDEYVCDGLAAWGFSPATRKNSRAQWKCVSRTLPHPVSITFDKGGFGFSLMMTGMLSVDAIGYEVGLADPFFFSGEIFYTSAADDLRGQMDRFFTEYYRIFPQVWQSLERAMTAANRFLV